MEQEYYYRYIGSSFDDTLIDLKTRNTDVEIKGKVFGWSGEINRIVITSKPIEDMNTDTIGFVGKFQPVSKEQFDAEISHGMGSIRVSENVAQEYAHELRLKNPNAQIYMTYDHNRKIGNIRSNVPLEQLKFFPNISYRMRNAFYGIDKDGNIGFTLNRVHNINVEFVNDRYYCVPSDSKYFGNSYTFNQNVNVNNNQPEITQEMINAAAERESARRLKIAHINRSINRKRQGKIVIGFLAAISAVGMIAAGEFSGIQEQLSGFNPESLLNSFEAWKEFLSKVTPAMWATLASYMVNAKIAVDLACEQRKATQELYDEENYDPNAFVEDAERQLRNR